MFFPRYMMVPALVLALSGLAGCHLIFRYEDNPAAPDTAPVQDGGPGLDQDPDAPPRPSDSAGLEFGRPDVTPYYLYELFNNSAGAVKAGGCTWNINKGFLNQDANYYNGCWVQAEVPANDYTAETYLQVHQIQSVKDWSEGAGLGVRVQANSSIPPVPPLMYVCAVSPDADQLVVARCPGSIFNNCTIMDSRPVSISVGKPYLVRVTVKGANLSCQLPVLGKTINYPQINLLKGGVSMITFFARASFDYLLVSPPL